MKSRSGQEVPVTDSAAALGEQPGLAAPDAFLSYSGKGRAGGDRSAHLLTPAPVRGPRCGVGTEHPAPRGIPTCEQGSGAPPRAFPPASSRAPRGVRVLPQLPDGPLAPPQAFLRPGLSASCFHRPLKI